MRHAGLAIVLVPRTDEVRDIDRGRRLGGIGQQQHAQAVGEPVFGDAFDASCLRHAAGQRGLGVGEESGTGERDEEDDAQERRVHGQGALSERSQYTREAVLAATEGLAGSAVVGAQAPSPPGI